MLRRRNAELGEHKTLERAIFGLERSDLVRRAIVSRRIATLSADIGLPLGPLSFRDFGLDSASLAESLRVSFCKEISSGTLVDQRMNELDRRARAAEATNHDDGAITNIGYGARRAQDCLVHAGYLLAGCCLAKPLASTTGRRTAAQARLAAKFLPTLFIIIELTGLLREAEENCVLTGASNNLQPTG